MVNFVLFVVYCFVVKIFMVGIEGLYLGVGSWVLKIKEGVVVWCNAPAVQCTWVGCCVVQRTCGATHLGWVLCGATHLRCNAPGLGVEGNKVMSCL